MPTTSFPVPPSRVDALLRPRSVAVAGAEWRHGCAAYETVRGLLGYGFRGALSVLSPAGTPVCGLPAYARIENLPHSPDLLVTAAPPERLAAEVAAAAAAGARAMVALRTPPGGRRRPAVPARPDAGVVARERGVLLVGPDSLGVLNTDPRVRLDAGLCPVRPPAGGLAVLVRSGAVGVALLDAAAHAGCGVSGYVSLGDGCGATAEELLAYWRQDPRTRAVAVHLDSYDGDDGPAAAAVRALARRKPVLTIGSALPAGDGADEPPGIVRTESPSELVDVARTVAGRPAPAGDRLVIAGNAGGLTALAAGTAAAHGFRIVPLGAATRAELPSVNGPLGRDNPVDVGLAATATLIAEAAETVAAGGEADALLLLLVGTRINAATGIVSACARVIGDYPRLPVAVVLAGGTDDRRTLGEPAAPVFRHPERAIRALAYARRYAGARRRRAVPQRTAVG